MVSLLHELKENFSYSLPAVLKSPSLTCYYYPRWLNSSLLPPFNSSGSVKTPVRHLLFLKPVEILGLKRLNCLERKNPTCLV